MATNLTNNISGIRVQIRVHSRASRGFTLAELILGLAIFVGLAAAVYASIVTLLPKSQAARVIADFNAVNAAFRVWMTDTDNFVFPSDDDNDPYPAGPFGASCGENEPVLGSTDLFSNVSARSGWNGPYLSKIPRTPWGREYLYDNDNDTYPSGGKHAGVNFRLIWCNDTEEKQHKAMLDHIDRLMDRGDGKDSGEVRWSSGDQAKADMLLSYTKDAP